VDPDSYEAENWPSRKPSRKTAQKVERELTRAAERTVRAALPAAGRAARAVQEAAPSLPTKVFVAAVGVAAYKGTRAVLDAIAEGKTDPAFMAAMAFRRARVALEQQLGRRVTREEMGELRRRIGLLMVTDQAVNRAVSPFGLGKLVDLISRAF